MQCRPAVVILRLDARALCNEDFRNFNVTRARRTHQRRRRFGGFGVGIAARAQEGVDGGEVTLLSRSDKGRIGTG
jgi:hypothetical protein